MYIICYYLANIMTEEIKEIRNVSEMVKSVSRPVEIINNRDWFLLRGNLYNLIHDENNVFECLGADNLIRGTVNLVNTVIEAQIKNDPYDTMVFLDLSARPAYYLFEKVLNKLEPEFQEQGFKIKKPKIRFLLAGTTDIDKYDSIISINKLKTIFDKNDFENKNILIVDEIIFSGTSSTSAKKSLIKAKYHPKKIDVISQFKDQPEWCGKDGLKGVDKPVYFDPEIRDTNNKLPVKLKKEIKDCLGILGYYRVIDLIENRYHSDKKNGFITENEINRLREKEMDFYEIIKKIENYCINNGLNVDRSLNTAISETVEFEATNGGFTALPPNKETLVKSNILKKQLSMMVNLVFDKKRKIIEVNVNKSSSNL